jgi:hypothetical protein
MYGLEHVETGLWPGQRLQFLPAAFILSEAKDPSFRAANPPYPARFAGQPLTIVGKLLQVLVSLLFLAPNNYNLKRFSRGIRERFAKNSSDFRLG